MESCANVVDQELQGNQVGVVLVVAPVPIVVARIEGVVCNTDERSVVQARRDPTIERIPK